MQGGETMKTYVMSDIHGRDDAYFDMLNQIGFDGFGKRDKIYIIGDVVDRGAGSIRILQHMMKHQDKIELLMGNHEWMMLQAIANDDYHMWMYNGGVATYEKFIELSKQEMIEILVFLKKAAYRKTVVANGKKYYLVHGRPYLPATQTQGTMQYAIATMPLQEQTLWAKMKLSYCMENQTVVFGHVCTKKYDEEVDNKEHYEIYEEGNMIGIDCGCSYIDGKGRLGCLCLHDGKKYYSSFVVEE